MSLLLFLVVHSCATTLHFTSSLVTGQTGIIGHN
jgi:hypothetical protein